MKVVNTHFQYYSKFNYELNYLGFIVVTLWGRVGVFNLRCEAFWRCGVVIVG